MDNNESSESKSLGEAYIALLRSTGAYSEAFDLTRSWSGLWRNHYSAGISQELLKNVLSITGSDKAWNQNSLWASNLIKKLVVADPAVSSRLSELVSNFYSSIYMHKPAEEVLVDPKFASVIADGAVFEELLSPGEVEDLLDDAWDGDESRWNAGEWWESLTGRQQMLFKLGTIGLMLVAIFVAIFMAQKEHASFGEFLADAAAPASIVSFVASLVSPYIMKTRAHPINKRIKRG